LKNLLHILLQNCGVLYSDAMVSVAKALCLPCSDFDTGRHISLPAADVTTLWAPVAVEGEKAPKWLHGDISVDDRIIDGVPDVGKEHVVVDDHRSRVVGIDAVVQVLRLVLSADCVLTNQARFQ
jgi:hypothetical protein